MTQTILRIYGVICVLIVAYSWVTLLKIDLFTAIRIEYEQSNAATRFAYVQFSFFVSLSLYLYFSGFLLIAHTFATF